MINIETPTYYTATKKYNLSFPTLEQDVEADVVIIGGGFSGINTALELAEKGITNIVVLEARYLGFGGTGRNRAISRLTVKLTLIWVRPNTILWVNIEPCSGVMNCGKTDR